MCLGVGELLSEVTPQIEVNALFLTSLTTTTTTTTTTPVTTGTTRALGP
jgi:hypothetical protein